MNIMRFAILALLAAGLTSAAQTAGRSASESTPVAPGPVTLARPLPGGPRPFNPAGLVGMVSLASRNYVVMFDGPPGAVPDRLRLLPMAGGGPVIEIPLASPGVGIYMADRPFLIPGTEWGCKSASLSPTKTGATVSFGAMLKAKRAQCNFGSKPVEFILLDANESGIFGDPSTLQAGDDGIAVRGKQKQGDIAIIGGEMYPLGQSFVGMGAVWKLASGDDGKMVAERQTVAAGAMVWRGSLPQDVRLTLAGKDVLLTNQRPLADGSWLVPVGDYRIDQCQYTLNGMQVIMDATAKPEGLKVTVATGKPLVIGPLPEIVGKVTPSVVEGSVRFDLSLSAPNGARVKLNGGPKPQLRVLAGNGQEVYRGSFEYG